MLFYPKGESMATKIGAAKYVECSVMTYDGVENVFEEAIIAWLYQKKFKIADRRAVFPVSLKQNSKLNFQKTIRVQQDEFSLFILLWIALDKDTIEA